MCYMSPWANATRGTSDTTHAMRAAHNSFEQMSGKFNARN